MNRDPVPTCSEQRPILLKVPQKLSCCMYIKNSVIPHTEFSNETVTQIFQRGLTASKFKELHVRQNVRQQPQKLREDEKNNNACLMNKTFGTGFVLCLCNASVPVTWLPSAILQ